MSVTQRGKGQSGELEIANILRELTGWDVRRRVRQHGGDSDLEGAPGWTVEVKRHRTAGRADIASWWRQAATQAAGKMPVLFYRLDRGDWRAVWPLLVCRAEPAANVRLDYEWTVEGTPLSWAAVAQEAGPLFAADPPVAPRLASLHTTAGSSGLAWQKPVRKNSSKAASRQLDLFEIR